MVNVKEIGKAHYDIDKVTYWTLHDKSLLSALIDEAAHDVGIPDEARDIWLGEVDHDDVNFIVTLYYDTDEVQS